MEKSKEKTLPLPPNWVQSLNQSLSKNAQLQNSKDFSIALCNDESGDSLCDYLRCEIILDKTKDGLAYYLQP